MSEFQSFLPNKKIIPNNIIEKKFIKYRDKRKVIFIKRFLNILSPFFIIIGIFLYYLTLLSACKGDNVTQANCLIDLNSGFFFILGFYMIVSIVILEIVLLLVIKRYISYYHLIYIIPLYIYFVHFYDTGGDLVHHGSYNKILFYLLIVIIGIILEFLLFLYSLYKKKYYKILCIIILSFLFIYIIVLIKVKYNCNKWPNGLGLYLENNPLRDKCYFIFPKKCSMDLIDGIFDVSRIIGENCETFRKDEKKEIFKYLSKDLQNSNYLAYPITLDYNWHNETHFENFYYKVMNDMIDMEKENNFEKGKKPEIFLKFDPVSQRGHIDIKLKKNETLIEERRKNYNKLDKDEIPKYKNFLFIYIDSLSRVHFMRKMKKSQKFLEQFYNSNSIYDLFQMIKYHSLLFYTLPNVHVMFYGESAFNENGTSILKLFKKKGYITGQAYDMCSREIYDIEKDNLKYTDFDNYDHENIAMFCDPNYYKRERPFTAFLGPYSFRRRCLYGIDVFDYVFEYGKQFWEAYINEPKFLRLAFIDGHEGTGEVISLLDVRLEKFLKNFQNNGYLNDTVIFFVSDHGNNMFGFYQIFSFEDFVTEKTLPFWIILFPKSVNAKEKSIIKENQQKFITAYDIHDTMIYLLNSNEGFYTRKGQTIFKPINAKERDCNFYDKEIPPEWCRCINYK